MKLKRMTALVALSTILGGTGFVLSARADVAVTDVAAKQRYPWNGLVDITCKVTGIDGETSLYFNSGYHSPYVLPLPQQRVFRSSCPRVR